MKQWCLFICNLICGYKCNIYVGVLRRLLWWRHHKPDGVSNHKRIAGLLNRLFRCRSKKTSKLRVTGLCEGNPPVTGEFPSQKASNADNVSIWWRHHVFSWILPEWPSFRDVFHQRNHTRLGTRSGISVSMQSGHYGSLFLYIACQELCTTSIIIRYSLIFKSTHAKYLWRNFTTPFSTEIGDMQGKWPLNYTVRARRINYGKENTFGWKRVNWQECQEPVPNVQDSVFITL